MVIEANHTIHVTYEYGQEDPPQSIMYCIGTPFFPDAPENQWAYTYIEYAAANGVVQGYPYPHPEDPDATIYLYLPDRIVTRAQMAVYVARAFELPM